VRTFVCASVFFLITLTSITVLAAGLPPIKSPQDAVLQLRLKGEAKQLLALKNLKTACSNRFRRSIKDAPGTVKGLQRLSRNGSLEVKKAVMDCFRCFSPRVFQKILAIQIIDGNAKVVSYAAEVSARVNDPAMLLPLMAEWEKKSSICLSAGLKKVDVERCVWLSYAPGASAAKASAETKEKLAKLAIKQFDSPYPKVREVAVETLLATGRAIDAAALKVLIQREKKAEFERNNDASLIGRFQKRLTTLQRKK
jgi:hypothetical protein